MIFFSATINDLHLQKEYGLVLENLNCVESPEVEEKIVDIPGRHGQIDLSSVLTGRPVYKNRMIHMVFGRGLERMRIPVYYSKLLTLYHGKEVKVIFDDDIGYFYTGRAKVTSKMQDWDIGKFSLEINASPYKLEIVTSSENWLWDPFCFELGVIREYKNIAVNGQKEIIVIGSSMLVVPNFICSTAMTLKYNDITYQLQAGQNKIYEITLEDKEYQFIFNGTGTVSIDFRGGIL